MEVGSEPDTDEGDGAGAGADAGVAGVDGKVFVAGWAGAAGAGAEVGVPTDALCTGATGSPAGGAGANAESGTGAAPAGIAVGAVVPGRATG
ncbi:hypothetical protein [Streptomyces olivaceiscleroticus]|uniref:Uncharacterized protein n=1 Tax=Streptomyces olivaceiscleroticus TaxID=68245 RepID=A0ABN0ZH00_9ACTN